MTTHGIHRAGLLVLLAVLSGACGGNVDVGSTGQTGTGGAGAGSSSSSTGTTGTGGAGGGSWTACFSPSGYGICNGPAMCPHGSDAANCPDCADSTAPISVCLNQALGEFQGVGEIWHCPDGAVYVDIGGFMSQGAYVPVLECAPFELAMLYKNAGYADRARYADFGLFTGDPLPEPETCPTIEGATVCGGHCGGCPPNYECTGRAPLHPYGICAPAKESCNDPGVLAFRWTVEAEAQPLADKHPVGCFPKATCENIANNLPGGGKCGAP